MCKSKSKIYPSEGGCTTTMKLMIVNNGNHQLALQARHSRNICLYRDIATLTKKYHKNIRGKAWEKIKKYVFTSESLRVALQVAWNFHEC